MKVDFWENYNEPGKEPGDDKLIREIDKIRFDAWVKANNLDPKETAWSAENFNKMEEWYLNLASAWQEVKEEISRVVFEEDNPADHEWAMGLRYSLKVIDKYLHQED